MWARVPIFDEGMVHSNIEPEKVSSSNSELATGESKAEAVLDRV